MAGLYLVVVPILAHSTGVQSGLAGITALNNGNYQDAIRLFTLALKAGDLKANDRELAYLKRGEAELDLGQVAPGLRDLRKALQLKPDDGGRCERPVRQRIGHEIVVTTAGLEIDGDYIGAYRLRRPDVINVVADTALHRV